MPRVEEDQVLVNPNEIMAGLIEMASPEGSTQARLAEAKAAIHKIARHEDFMDHGPKEVIDQVAVIANKVNYLETVIDSLVFFTHKTMSEFMPEKEG